MCACVKHVSVDCCFVSLLLGTSIKATLSVRIYWEGAEVIIFQSVFFFFCCIILEDCIRFSNAVCNEIIN